MNEQHEQVPFRTLGSERLFCLTIVLAVDEKWFTARIKPPQVRLIAVADGMSEETGRFRLESLGSPFRAAAGLLRQLTCCCISGATVSTIHDKLARM